MLPAKPADLYLGVVDLFGVLIPGLVLAAIVAPHAEPLFEVGVIETPSIGAETVGFYFVAGWILGQLLRGAGELLDLTLYDKWYLPAFKQRPETPSWFESRHLATSRDWRLRDKLRLALVLLIPSRDRSRNLSDALRRKAEELARDELGPMAGDAPQTVPLGLNGWVQVEVARTDPAAHATADRLTADSKFFRSIFFVTLFAAVLSDHTWRPLAACGLMAAASLVVYCRFRWKASLTLFRSYVQVRLSAAELAQDSRSPKG